MDMKRLLGLVFIILGILFIVYPLYSAATVSFIAGISLIAFGFAAIIDGFSLLSVMAHMTVIEVVLGIFAMLLGILFIYSIDALSFIVGFQFYLIAFVLMIIGIIGLITRPGALGKIGSIMILVLGIITVYLAAVSVANPQLVAILVGVGLIIEGIFLVVIPTFDEAKAIEG